MKKYKYVLLSIVCLLVGLLMLVMGITDPEFEVGSRIGIILSGILFLAGALALFGMGAPAIAEARRMRAEKKLRWKNRFNIFENAENAPDTCEEEKLLGDFRKDLASFYLQENIVENAPLQSDTTQLFWNVSAMQKKRLLRKQIRMKLLMERKQYEGMQPVTAKQFFDGKYEVSEYDETVAVEKIFSRGESEICTNRNRFIAHTVTTNAKKVGKDFYCPNCGAKSSRENLIDGCDFCRTRFRVEDLGCKVSSFRLRDDYALRYAEYKEARSHYNERAFWIQAIVWFVTFMLVGIFGGEGYRDIDENLAVVLLSMPLAAAMGAGMLAFLGLLPFWLFVFPLLQANASIRYVTKKRLNTIKIRSAQDVAAEEQIKKTDPLFSITDFYSGIQNKLAVIHYGDTAEGVQAFFEEDLPGIFGRYDNVVDMDLVDVQVKSYAVEEGLQKIRVAAELRLTEAMDVPADFRAKSPANVPMNIRTDAPVNATEKGGTARPNHLTVAYRKERLQLLLIKEEACKTQAVCGPRLFTCRGCGASLSLENGKLCSHCKTAVDFKRYDWIIREYVIR